MAVDRKLAFYAWANTNEKHPFDRLKGAKALKGLGKEQIVLDDGDGQLTAVEIVAEGNQDKPTKLRLHALHGPGNRPSEYGPGVGTSTIQIGKGKYTAFTSYVMIWEDKVAATDVHANSPGLGRLAVYFRKQGHERVVFRPLYNQGTVDRLKDLDGIRGVDFAIHEPHKIVQARKRGMLRSLIPSRKFPSIRVAAGMSRKEPKDSYLDPEVEEELLTLADDAEQFFDRLIVRGLSKTERTATGQKKSVTINLLSERLHIEQSLKNDPLNPNLPGQSQVFAALSSARKTVEENGDLENAVEARLSYDEG
jgi:hypothetical protein